MPEIPQPDADTPIINSEGKMEDAFQAWVSRMTNLDLIVGTGTPEGVIEATVGREYLDQTGSVGAIKYIKQLADDGSGNKAKGWVAI